MSKQTIQTVFYGKSGKLQEKINLSTFTSDDRLILPSTKSQEPENLKHLESLRKNGREGMELVGAGDEYPQFQGEPLNKNPFTKKSVENSPLSKLLKGENVSIFEKIGYTQQNIETSLESVKVFYSAGHSTGVEIKNSMLNRVGVEIENEYYTQEKLHAIGGKRVMAAKCHIFSNNKYKVLDEIKKATVFDVSSPDLKKDYNKELYVENDQLNEDYKNQIDETIKLLFESSKKMGCKSIIIPAIGSGSFGGDHKKEVLTIVALSIKKLIEKDDYGLESIICSVSQDAYIAYEKAFEGYKGEVEIMITEVEMTNIAIELNDIYPEYEVGYIMAGNPIAPIGHYWIITKEGDFVGSQEEACAKHFVDFIVAMDGYWNSENIFGVERDEINENTELKEDTVYSLEITQEGSIKEKVEREEIKDLIEIIEETLIPSDVEEKDPSITGTNPPINDSDFEI